MRENDKLIILGFLCFVLYAIWNQPIPASDLGVGGIRQAPCEKWAGLGECRSILEYRPRAGIICLIDGDSDWKWCTEG